MQAVKAWFVGRCGVVLAGNEDVVGFLRGQGDIGFRCGGGLFGLWLAGFGRFGSWQLGGAGCGVIFFSRTITRREEKCSAS